MSGKATGWALKHFPITTPADRNRKLVLVGVADQANADGTYARPGLASLMAEWKFDKATVIRHLNWLTDNGWLEVIEKGLGRGHATSYSLPKMVAHYAEKGSQAATVPEPERSQPDPGKVAIGDPALSLSTEENYEGPPTPAPKPLERRIVERVWERKNPKPATPFVAVVKIARKLLDAGWEPQRIEDAMVAVPTISIGWLEGNLNGNGSRQRGQAGADDKQARIDQRFGFTNGANA